jgi:hypothetical protein
MALSISGATGAYAQSAAVMKTPAAQAGANYDGNTTVYYHFTDAGGRAISMRQSGPNDGPVVAANGPSGSTTILEFVAGGQQGDGLLRLTQQNCVDLIAGIVAFANTGTLS